MSLLPTSSQLLCPQWDAYPILSLLRLQCLGCPHGKNCLLQILTINRLLNLLVVVPGKPPFFLGDSDTSIGTGQIFILFQIKTVLSVPKLMFIPHTNKKQENA